jgi:hypothetical protein
MGKWEIGLTVLLVGVGGTFLVLGICSLVMELLKRIFPYKEER